MGCRDPQSTGGTPVTIHYRYGVWLAGWSNDEDVRNGHEQCSIRWLHRLPASLLQTDEQQDATITTSQGCRLRRPSDCNAWLASKKIMSGCPVSIASFVYD